MSDTATIPAESPQMAAKGPVNDATLPECGDEAMQRQLHSRITTANARLLALKSWEVRRQAAKEREAVAVEPLPEPPKPENPLETRAREIEMMIDQTMKAYVEADLPRDKQALAMSLDRLFGTWALLTGHERPGVRRSAKPRATPGAIPGME
jgi:hypothetical protein